MIGLFGYCWIPLSIYVYSQWLKAESQKIRRFIEIALLVLGVMASASVHFDWNNPPRLGIIPGSNNAAEFFKRQKIGGTIYNNYDIGSYLIFHLVPDHKVFIDGRPEAYPYSFLSETSFKWNEVMWHKYDQKYHFNVIFINPDHTDFGRKFLIHRFEDPDWAPVYLSNEAIILLRRNKENAQLIKRFEIKEDKITITF